MYFRKHERAQTKKRINDDYSIKQGNERIAKKNSFKRKPNSSQFGRNFDFKILRRKKVTVFFILIFSFFCFSSLGQSYYITPLDSLISEIELLQKTQTQEQTTAINTQKQYKWLRILPSFGWNFILNTPSITFGTQQIASYLEARDQRNYQVSEVERLSKYKINESINRLKSLYNTIINQLDSYHYGMQIFEVDKQLFAITEEQYKNLKIATEQYLKEKRNYMTKVVAIYEKKQAILDQASQINDLIKRQIVISSKLLKIKDLEKIGGGATNP